MTPEVFQEQVKQLKIGKRLPGAVYLHRSTFQHELPELSRWVQAKITDFGQDVKWTVIKLNTNQFGVSLLNYPDFYKDSYPELVSSFKVDFERERYRHNRFSSVNPPILHRKETMVKPDDPYYQEFCCITQEGEDAGLYENIRIIGFKKSWEALIREKGYVLVDGRLFRQAAVDLQTIKSHKVDRHKTAISRDSFSAPMKTLARYGYLNGEYSVFDYGCGHGDDLAELAAHGILSSGWDPNWRADGTKADADLVNVGYVINVIEDLNERVEAVQGAWSLTRKLLVVSAMIASEQHISKFQSFKDGVITSRNTFQKYFSQSELQIFIEQILDVEPIPVAPGVFYIFRDKDEEQLFLSKKQRRATVWKQLVYKTVRIPKRKQFLEDNRELFNRFWQCALELGRVPSPDEFSESSALQTILGSPKKAFSFLKHEFDTADLEKAAKERREDLLVYFALQQFNKKRVYKHMPEQLKRDIKAFFGDYKTVQQEAKELLFSLGQPGLIHQACTHAYDTISASIYNDNHSLVLHSKFMNDLPAVLRVYVGCAAQLFSDTDGVDLVKIHIRSGKLTLMNYENFESSPIPMLRERIKINMRNRHVDFFDYGYGDYEPQPLYWKSLLLDETFSDYNKQKSFDKRLKELELPDMDGYGLSSEDFHAVLKHGYGLEVRGYRFFKLAQRETALETPWRCSN